MIGITREDVEDTSVMEVWPENWLPFVIFADVGTQWRVGVGGATALDYNVVFQMMKLRNVKKKDRLEVMEAITVMEQAALAQMNKSKG